MDTLDKERVGRFFSSVSAAFPISSRIATILVTHILPDRPLLIDALSKCTDLQLIVAKPKSVHLETKNLLASKYNVVVPRARFRDGREALKFIDGHVPAGPFAILDIGGYFAGLPDEIASNSGGRLLGIVEDTENGVQKYESANPCSYPVISVARSPLKAPEDYLVGQSIVFSTEALLRNQGDILHGRTACVVGYGKLGQSIARLLHARHVRTVVYDINPLRTVEALSHGFTVAPDLQRALRGAGLVFCATGHLSMNKGDFEKLDNGAYVVTVTSSDDELDLKSIKDVYDHSQITDYVTRCRCGPHHFYLLNRGQAVNFIHGAAVGPFIFLVQGEILASIALLVNGGPPMGVSENSDEMRRKVASLWLETFGPGPWRTDA